MASPGVGYWDGVSATLLSAERDALVSFPSPSEEGSRQLPFSVLREEGGPKARAGAAAAKARAGAAQRTSHWMPDRLCKTCFYCEQPFTRLRRRHHCRLCGQVFCAQCSTHKVEGGLRACRACYDQVKQWKQWRPQGAAAHRLDGGVWQLGEVGEGALLDAPVFAVGLPEEDGGWRGAIADALDIHGYRLYRYRQLYQDKIETNKTFTWLQMT